VTDLAQQLLLGCGLLCLAAIAAMVWLFGAPLLSARLPWPPALNARESVTGGRLKAGGAVCLFAGVVAGFWSGSVAPAPIASSFGLAFLGNSFGLGIFAVGMIIRPWSTCLSHSWSEPAAPRSYKQGS
jgi:hypothetical protein